MVITQSAPVRVCLYGQFSGSDVFAVSVRSVKCLPYLNDINIWNGFDWLDFSIALFILACAKVAD